MKFAVLVAVPEVDTTVSGPVGAPAGTVAANCVFEVIEKFAVTPPNSTSVAVENPEPLNVTAAPIVPLVGENPVIAGPLPVPADATTVKLPALVAVPPPLVVTVIAPVVAPAGTCAVIAVEEFIVKIAAVPLNCTPLAESRLVPLITTVVPAVPLVGAKPVTVGAPAVPLETRSCLSVAPRGDPSPVTRSNPAVHE